MAFLLLHDSSPPGGEAGRRIEAVRPAHPASPPDGADEKKSTNARQFNLSVSTSTISASSMALSSISAWSTTATPSRALAVTGLPSAAGHLDLALGRHEIGRLAVELLADRLARLQRAGIQRAVGIERDRARHGRGPRPAAPACRRVLRPGTAPSPSAPARPPCWAGSRSGTARSRPSPCCTRRAGCRCPRSSPGSGPPRCGPGCRDGPCA